ncbi:MAG TPA: OmpA family protein [Longimicrobiales bacterium]
MLVHKQITVRKLARGGSLALIALLGACGYAKQDQVQAELDKLRQEMQSQDEALASQMGEMDARLSGRLDALEREIGALREEFDVTVRRLEGAIAFDMPVHFEFDKAELRESDKPVLDRFAAVVKEFYPNAIVTVEGFTDPAGSRDYNLRLGKRRAEAVKAYLTEAAGLDASRLRAVSYGESPERLLVPGAAGANDNAELNRRVSLVIEYSGPEVQQVTLVTPSDG